MIIAEATTKSGKLVQVKAGPYRTSGPALRTYEVLVEGKPSCDDLLRDQAKRLFFRECQEGCEQ